MSLPLPASAEVQLLHDSACYAMAAGCIYLKAHMRLRKLKLHLKEHFNVSVSECA